jgi:hypothetical protein
VFIESVMLGAAVKVNPFRLVAPTVRVVTVVLHTPHEAAGNRAREGDKTLEGPQRQPKANRDGGPGHDPIIHESIPSTHSTRIHFAFMQVYL